MDTSADGREGVSLPQQGVDTGADQWKIDSTGLARIMSNAAKVKANMAPSSFDPFPPPMVRLNRFVLLLVTSLYGFNRFLSAIENDHPLRRFHELNGHEIRGYAARVIR